jgi:hypothetical protein
MTDNNIKMDVNAELWIRIKSLGYNKQEDMKIRRYNKIVNP